MNFKVNGAYICSLVEEDFIPGNFFSKNSRLKLLDYVVNQAGKPSSSILSMLDSYFFISFYEENNQIYGACFGYSWMRPFDIADSFIGVTDDYLKKMVGDCSDFQLSGSHAKFKYRIGQDNFEVNCILRRNTESSDLHENHMEVYVKNTTRKLNASGMKFRFVSSMNQRDKENRRYS